MFTFDTLYLTLKIFEGSLINDLFDFAEFYYGISLQTANISPLPTQPPQESGS